MTRMIQQMASLELWKDRRGQDLVEYALMAGFVAVMAGAGSERQRVQQGQFRPRRGANSVMTFAAANPISHLI